MNDVPFALLVDEHLESVDRRMLRAILSSTGLLNTAVWCFTWPQVQAVDSRMVLSVGKQALDAWHQWGCIQVGHQRGNVFEHRARDGDRYTIMVVEHPGTLMQQSMIGSTAKANMKMDMRNWAARLNRYAFAGSQMRMCGRCQATRVKGGGGRTRPAEHWPPELDGAGLCSEHYRTRGRIKSRWKVKRVDKSSKAAQIGGQLEGFAGDGTRIVVRK